MTISSDLFKHTTNLEHFRRIRKYLLSFYAAESASGASKAELATIRGELDFIDRLIKMNHIHPLDTPMRPCDHLPPHVPGQGGAVSQPLVPQGAEKEMSAFIDMLLEETRK